MDKQPKTKKPVKFTPEQLAMIDEGIAQMERGEFLTEEQTFELARKKTQAWMSVTPENLSA